ncbi:MAG: hypothetical protein ABL973_11265 [Micropepsaceae bacterium]
MDLCTLRRSVRDGLAAAETAKLYGEVLKTADRRPTHESVEQFAKLSSIAEASLGQALQAQTANGGEVVALEDEMKFEAPGLYDALTAPPTVLQAVASRDRMEVLGKSDTTALGVDLAQSVGANGSLEQSLSHQIATAHSLAMRFMGTAHAELQRYDTARDPIYSVEASRCANTASRLMAAVGGAALVLERLQAARAARRPRPSTKTSVQVVNITKERQE